ncbi:SH3 domain-containing protein [Variovorax sp. LARHSF232]
MPEQTTRTTISLRWRMRSALVAGALALPLAAFAQQAFTRAGVGLMAGPGNNYPEVAYLYQGQPVDVIGCTRGYGWCDVVLPDGLRGWIYAAILEYPYQGSPVPLPGYGAVIGVPIVTFSIGSYWGRYYRDRPWYPEPRWWGGRPPPPPVAGWRPPPPQVPAWRPRPGPPPPDFRPPRPPAWQVPVPSREVRPPRDPGVHPPRPGVVPGGPPPGRPAHLGDNRQWDNHGGGHGRRDDGNRGHRGDDRGDKGNRAERGDRQDRGDRGQGQGQGQGHGNRGQGGRD